LGAVGFIRLAPTLLFSLFAGVIADRFRRRHVLIVTQSALLILALILALLTLKGQITLRVIYIIIAAQATALTFDLPARQSLIPNLVPSQDLPNAFSLQILAFQIGAFAGPTFSGLAIDRFGVAGPYLISLLGFGSMLLVLYKIGPVSQKMSLPKRSGVDREAISEGVRFTFHHPLILSSMLLDFFVTFFTRADTLMPIFARDILFVGPVAYGWLSAAQSLGASLASLILSQIKSLPRQGLFLLGAVTCVGLGTIVFGSSGLFAISMAALMLVGASDAVSSVIRNTIRQVQTPDQLRGRMVSVNQIFFMGGPQLGEVRAGLLGSWIGVPLAVASGGVACLVAVGLIAARWPDLRAYSGDETQLKIPV
jgi:MFS family permease